MAQGLLSRKNSQMLVAFRLFVGRPCTYRLGPGGTPNRCHRKSRLRNARRSDETTKADAGYLVSNPIQVLRVRNIRFEFAFLVWQPN